MHHTRCVFSPMRALQNVFLSHLDLSARRSIAAAAAPSSTYLYPRLFSTNGGVRMMKRYGRRPNNSQQNQKPGVELTTRFPIDNAIPYKFVKVADETGTLSKPQRTSAVLASLDRDKYALVMVAPPPEPNEEEEGEEEGGGGGGTSGGAAEAVSFQDMPLPEPEAAICRIIDKHEYARAAEEKKKEERRKKITTKELELNWAIAPHDLSHKVGQLQAFLGKGKTVQLMLARKKGGRVATAEEAEDLLQKLEAAAADVSAVIAKREGEFPGIVKLKFERRKKV